jgi:ethanolamine utilization microcompartment shell protein EutL
LEKVVPSALGQVRPADRGAAFAGTDVAEVRRGMQAAAVKVVNAQGESLVVEAGHLRSHLHRTGLRLQHDASLRSAG